MSNMVVRTNIYSVNAHRNMKNVGLEQKRASNRLASGYRINSAADDAAGLAISENMRAQIRGLDQASRNAQDGQAMILTTEGGLEEIGNMLQRVRELLVQSANDINTQDQRGLIEQEVNQLGREILSMQQRVEFNTNRVLAMGPNVDTVTLVNLTKLDNSATAAAGWAGEANTKMDEIRAALELLNEVGAGERVAALGGAYSDAITKALGSVAATSLQTGDVVANGSLQIFSFVGTAQTTAASGVGSMIDVLNGLLASMESRMDSTLDAATTSIRSTNETVYNAMRSFATASTSGNNVAYYQVGANSSQGVSFDFETVSRAVSAAGRTVQAISYAMSAAAAGSGIGNGIRTSPMIGMVQSSLDDVGRIRANLGALQNRMDYTMRSLDISSENLQDSESRVRNADIAKEMMKFTMSNVLQQASVSMLSQANQMPQNLLQLLR